jgi:hypothetical protein
MLSPRFEQGAFDTASRSLVQLSFVIREKGVSSLQCSMYMHVLRVFATRSQVGVSGEGWGWGYAFDAIFAISNGEDVLSSLEGYRSINCARSNDPVPRMYVRLLGRRVNRFTVDECGSTEGDK